jgi:hypothetical protein
MGQSLLLGIYELAPGQTNAYTTVNDAVASLENASNRSLTITTTGNYTVTMIDMTSYGRIIFAGATANSTITFPITIISTNPTNRSLWLSNDSTLYTHTVQMAGGSTSVSLPPSSSRAVQMTGNVITALTAAASGTASGVVPHSVSFFTAGVPAHEAEVLRYSFTEPVSFSIGLTESRGSILTPPSKTSSFNLFKNNTQFGTCSVSTGGVFSFSSASVTSFAIGDVLTIKSFKAQSGSLTFNTIPDANDSVGIYDGVTKKTFTFGTLSGQVSPGASTTAAATNLLTAINASSLATNLTTTVAGSVLSITNNRSQRDGDLTKNESASVLFNTVADVGDSITISDGLVSVTFTFFASASSGLNVFTGASASDSATNLKAAITANGTLDVVQYISGSTLFITNNNQSGGGSFLKVDANNSYTINSFVTDPNASITLNTFSFDTTGANYGVTLRGTRL